MFGSKSVVANTAVSQRARRVGTHRGGCDPAHGAAEGGRGGSPPLPLSRAAENESGATFDGVLAGICHARQSWAIVGVERG